MSFSTKVVPYHFESTTTPQPFTLTVNPDFIKQTADKVKGYRPSTDLDDDSNQDWSDGPPASSMAALAEYWASEYDWDKVQAQVNAQFSHFTVTIPETSSYRAELPLHFVHERSAAEDAIPLLLLHGWPSSHLEWEKVIHLLVSPEEPDSPSFHVVAPDMPGSGFSPAPTISGLGPREMALAFDQLMSTLGYNSYGIVTTDLGWELGMWMVSDVGHNIIGHMTDFFIPQPTPSDFGRLQSNQTTPQEAEYLQSLQAYMNNHAAYASIQAQAPLTLAQAMADTPVGYAGWIWHLMNAVSDGYAYTHDEIITSTMMLWLQGPYGNLRTYKEFYKPGLMDFPRTEIPTGFSQWLNPNGPYQDLRRFPSAPREWIERVANVVYMVTHDFGGHFPAVSYPELWVNDTRQFFKIVKNTTTNP